MLGSVTAVPPRNCDACSLTGGATDKLTCVSGTEKNAGPGCGFHSLLRPRHGQRYLVCGRPRDAGRVPSVRLRRGTAVCQPVLSVPFSVAAELVSPSWESRMTYRAHRRGCISRRVPNKAGYEGHLRGRFDALAVSSFWAHHAHCRACPRFSFGSSFLTPFLPLPAAHARSCS